MNFEVLFNYYYREWIEKQWYYEKSLTSVQCKLVPQGPVNCREPFDRRKQAALNVVHTQCSSDARKC